MNSLVTSVAICNLLSQYYVTQYLTRIYLNTFSHFLLMFDLDNLPYSLESCTLYVLKFIHRKKVYFKFEVTIIKNCKLVT